MLINKKYNKIFLYMDKYASYLEEKINFLNLKI